MLLRTKLNLVIISILILTMTTLTGIIFWKTKTSLRKEVVSKMQSQVDMIHYMLQDTYKNANDKLKVDVNAFEKLAEAEGNFNNFFDSLTVS